MEIQEFENGDVQISMPMGGGKIWQSVILKSETVDKIAELLKSRLK